MVENSRFSLTLNNGKKAFEILFTGDLCPVGGVEKALQNGHETKIVDSFSREFSTACLVVANLECPLTRCTQRTPKVGPHLKADPVTVEVLKQCNVDVANLANNHIMDFGEAGLLDTIDALTRAGIETVGAGMNLDEACRPLVRTVKGIRLALLSCCETEFNIAGDGAGCAPIVERRVVHMIRAAKADGAKVVIVSLHCGSEHYPLPSPRIQRLCRQIAEGGAAAVVCHHTHIFSGFEVHEGVPIFYGLGNFIFDRRYRECPPHWHVGFMAQIAFSQDSAVAFTLTPYTFDSVSTILKPLAPHGLLAFQERIQALSEVIADENRLARIWRRHATRRYREWYLPMQINCHFNLLKPRNQRNLLLWHYRANESHNDVITTALAEMCHETFDMVLPDDDIVGDFFHQSPLHFKVLGRIFDR